MSVLEEIIGSAREGGWDFFDKLPGDIADRVAIEKARDEEQGRMIAGAWAKFASTPDGAQALELLFRSTLRRTVFFVNLNLPPEQVMNWGAFREGQNALAYEIARQIAKGMQQDPPEPREIA